MEILKTEYEYLIFVEMPSAGKTSRYSCRNKKHNEQLGVIKWDGGWRQYVYLDTTPAKYSAGCLKDIGDFIKQLMEERKDNK